MAGLIRRTSEITQAKVSKRLDRAENPEETLDYSYEQQLQRCAPSTRSSVTPASHSTTHISAPQTP